MKKMIAMMMCVLTLTCCLILPASATPSRGELFRFIPITLTVNNDEVKVEGYFLNLNSDVTIKNLKNLVLSIYLDGDLLVTGDFGTVNDSFSPKRAKYYTVTFHNNDQDLNNGTYDCDESIYAAFSCSFSTENA